MLCATRIDRNSFIHSIVFRSARLYKKATKAAERMMKNRQHIIMYNCKDVLYIL